MCESRWIIQEPRIGDDSSLVQQGGGSERKLGVVGDGSQILNSTHALECAPSLIGPGKLSAKETGEFRAEFGSGMSTKSWRQSRGTWTPRVFVSRSVVIHRTVQLLMDLRELFKGRIAFYDSGFVSSSKPVPPATQYTGVISIASPPCKRLCKYNRNITSTFMPQPSAFASLQHSNSHTRVLQALLLFQQLGHDHWRRRNYTLQTRLFIKDAKYLLLEYRQLCSLPHVYTLDRKSVV